MVIFFLFLLFFFLTFVPSLFFFLVFLYYLLYNSSTFLCKSKKKEYNRTHLVITSFSFIKDIYIYKDQVMGQPQSNISSVTMDTPNSYPQKDQTSPTKRPQPKKLPPPHMGSFFDAQMAAPLPHAHVRKPNRPKNDFNFYFEAASVTPQPATSANSRSQNSSSKKSSSYAASYKNCTRTTTNSSSSSSTTSSTLVNEQNEHSLKHEKAERKPSNHCVIQGRKYWKGSSSQNFFLPHDDEESDRLMTLVS
ncbi:hypothetical protein BD560DRAFT_129977 [Blakeslea trispora]|nr:hypothetical protein BD560DRAFT_129977 [Blakeslea trispora]